MGLKTLARGILGETFVGMLDYYRFPELRASWGGPFNGQAFRQQIYLELIQTIEFSAIAETGTYRGTTTEYLHQTSRLPVHTVELQPRWHGFARGRFLFTKKVRPFCGDSRPFLRRFVENPAFIGKPILVYLDAHWGEDLPLREEIEIVFRSAARAVVMIDDFEVPGDVGYRFDDYGNGQVLSLEYLAPPMRQFNVAAFFPRQGSDSETGAKRGCAVLASNPDLVGKIEAMKTLVRHRPR